MVQRGTYISEHHCAGERCGNRATPEVALRRGQQMFAVTFLETRFEPFGEIRGELYGRKIPDEKERSSDLCVVLRAALAFSNMPLHPNQLDPGKGIVYECNVLLTKLATIHGDRLRVR